MAAPDPDLAVLGTAAALARLLPEDLATLYPELDQMVFAPGSVVVHEGDAGDSMYVILEGTARLGRGGVELGVLAAGEHFGELGLLGAERRAATVTALRSLRVARLTAARYQRFVASHPAAAARLVEALAASLGRQLATMTDSVGLLLRERLLPRRAEVVVTVGETRRQVPTGTRIAALLDGAGAVAALLDSRPVSLDTPVVSDAVIAPLLASSAEGREVIRRSLGLLLLELAARAGVSLELGAHLDTAQPVAVPGGGDLVELAASLDHALADAVAARTAFREEVWTVEEARTELAGADILDTWRDGAIALVSCGRRYALRVGPVVPHAGFLAGARVTAARGGLLLHFGPAGSRPDANGELAGEERVPRFASEMVAEGARWRASLGVTTVGAFNRACVSGQVAEIIRVAEGFHEKRIGRIADAIFARAGTLRAIAIAGPSSSGKTTFIKRLTTQLVVAGIRPVALSLDDYYVDRERTPLDPDGAYDFEALEALDLVGLRRDVGRVLAGGRVRTPRYDFTTGRSLAEAGPELAVGAGEVLLLEGIHGLNPALLGDAVPASALYRVFVHPATTLPIDALSRVSPHDLRLLRRIVRDRRHRGISVADNIGRWPSVRRGETRHIYPFLADADVVFDSALVYETAVVKVYAERYLLEVPRRHPSYVTADRLRHLVDHFVAIYPDHVPPTSLLREFIGGSGFDY